MPENVSSIEIKELASLLELRRKHHQRTVLFIGSRAGGFFRSQDFYDTLEPFSKRSFSTLQHTEQFVECHKLLQRLSFSERDLFNILSHALNNLPLSKADLCLANLIKAQFFDIVISTNMDDSIERALIEVGLKALQHFQVLVPRHDLDYDVVYGQRNISCWLVKVFGDLMSRSYNILARNAHLGDTEYVRLRRFLEKSLAGDILVVGLDPVWDKGALSAFPITGGQYWFVNEEAFTEDSLLTSTWRSRHVRYLMEDGGSYEYFFPALYENLQSVDLREIAQPASGSSPHLLPLQKRESLVSTPSKQHLADVLLVTVTDVEAMAVLDLFPQSQICYIGDRTYYNLGVIGGAKIFMARSWMGASGPGGSLFTVAEGIQAVSPSAVIMLGIAFGLYPKKQKIGDILISQQLLAYDSQRVGTATDGRLLISLRGDRVLSSVRLLDRFKAGKLNENFQAWIQSPQVDFGLILSGSKLVDNKDFRDQLLALAPEAIGGEMEGAGLYDAAQRYKVDWLLVKAICDWADGKKHFKKKERQKLAAGNAARFVIHVIEQGGFT